MTLRVSLFLALVCVCTARGGASEICRLDKVVPSVIEPLLAEFGIPGMAVGITVADETRFYYFGVAAKNPAIPVGKGTLFEVGSVSKTFTATLAAYAAELGSISFDDHPSRFMPELANTPVDRATFLNLLTYSAGGLPLQFPDDVESKGDLVTYFREWTPTSVPGAQRFYSNPSIGLAGHLASIALNEPFDVAIESRLLPALGLTHTFINIPSYLKNEYAWGHDAADRQVRVSPGLFDAEAYGIKTTAEDLIQYLRHQIDPSGLPRPWEAALRRTHDGAYAVGGMVQCLGWEKYAYPVSEERLLEGNSGRVILEPNSTRALNNDEVRQASAFFNKTGSTRGFGAYVAFIPEKKMGIVLLANKSYPIAARIRASMRILEAVNAGSSSSGPRD